MICVLSQAFLEDTTDAVTDWLRAWKVPHVRINGGDIDDHGGPSFSVGAAGAKAEIAIDGVPLDLDQVKVVWYRRWAYNNRHRTGSLFTDPSHATGENIYSVYSHLNSELRTVSSFLFILMESAEWLGHPSTTTPNKLKVLKLAAEAGLDVPETLVTPEIDVLREFMRKHGSVVAKPASDTVTLTLDGKMLAIYTSVVSDSFLDDAVWDGSFPSLFQEKLDKKYEIRTFYLDGEFYSMGMFTQQKASTQVDFRRYSLSDPARTVPYKLPSDIEEKLRTVMKALRLDTGSIDMVRTTDGRFVFLEVNPVGQFGMVSYPCNYFLERKVAGALVERLNGTRKTA